MPSDCDPKERRVVFTRTVKTTRIEMLNSPDQHLSEVLKQITPSHCNQQLPPAEKTKRIGMIEDLEQELRAPQPKPRNFWEFLGKVARISGAAKLAELLATLLHKLSGPRA